MPFASALSTASDTNRAIQETCRQALDRLKGKPDLAVVFFSPHHAALAGTIASTMQERLEVGSMIGCVGESIIGTDQEVENHPALSLWLAHWARPVNMETFHLGLFDTPDGQSLLGWPDGMMGANPTQAVMLLLGDPRTFPIDMFLQRMNQEHGGLRVMGGMASGHQNLENCVLIIDGQVVSMGAVGVLLQGPVGLRSVVSQGCRPIGRHMVITRCEDNIITGLSGHRPMAQLQQLWQELTPAEQFLFQQGLHIGLVINEYGGEFQRGDFLVRNVLGLDKETGSMAVTDRIRVGQTVQFHVRDAETADEDLRELLQLDLSAHEARPRGALLFSCNGRGTRLFSKPHHDARTIKSEVGAIPVAGFFAQGELGPIRGQNFIHGFTASVALFEE